MLYVCETRALTKDCERKTIAFERKCYRKVMNEELYTMRPDSPRDFGAI